MAGYGLPQVSTWAFGPGKQMKNQEGYDVFLMA
jgi:hypothetical protein